MVFNVVLELKIPANEKKHGKYALLYICSPVQFSRLVISSSTTPWTAALQASCPSPTPGVYSNRVHRVHRVGVAIQPSQPLLSPSPPAFNLAQH